MCPRRPGCEECWRVFTILFSYPLVFITPRDRSHFHLQYWLSHSFSHRSLWEPALPGVYQRYRAFRTTSWLQEPSELHLCALFWESLLACLLLPSSYVFEFILWLLPGFLCRMCIPLMPSPHFQAYPAPGVGSTSVIIYL